MQIAEIRTSADFRGAFSPPKGLVSVSSFASLAWRSAATLPVKPVPTRPTCASTPSRCTPTRSERSRPFSALNPPITTSLPARHFALVQLPVRPAGTRFIQVQRNLPGELRRLNDVFANRGINIAAQYYQTDGEVGYVVLDADGAVDDAESVLDQIRDLPGTIRARLLYRGS